MSKAINQPASPVDRLPAYLRPQYAAEVHEEEERAAKAARHADSRPVRITEIDVPFEQVFMLVFKVFISWAVLAAIVGMIWFLLSR